MPPWLILILTLAGMVLLVGLEAAAVMGDWRVFFRALRGFALYLGMLAAPAAVVSLAMYLWRL